MKTRYKKSIISVLHAHRNHTAAYTYWTIVILIDTYIPESVTFQKYKSCVFSAISLYLSRIFLSSIVIWWQPLFWVEKYTKLKNMNWKKIILQSNQFRLRCIFGWDEIRFKVTEIFKYDSRIWEIIVMSSIYSTNVYQRYVQM